MHYPSFRFVGESDFSQFTDFHNQRITWIVLPVMVVELLSGLYLALYAGGAWWVNLGGVLLIWASTFFLSVPLHGELASAKSIAVIQRLVLTNWPRTFLWTVRSLFFLYLLCV